MRATFDASSQQLCEPGSGNLRDPNIETIAYETYNQAYSDRLRTEYA